MQEINNIVWQNVSYLLTFCIEWDMVISKHLSNWPYAKHIKISLQMLNFSKTFSSCLQLSPVEKE